MLALLLSALALAPSQRSLAPEAGGQRETSSPASDVDPRLRRAGDAWVLDDAGRTYLVDPEVVSARFVGDTGDFATFKAQVAAEPGASALLTGLTLVRSNRLGIHDLRVTDGADPVATVAALRATGLVEFAEVNGTGDFLNTPDDLFFSTQYHLRNTGQSGGVVGADIDAELAWDLAVGDPSIVIAVLDSGMEISHPDLAANLWVNADETANGLDDDGNGFADDFNGWDFHAGNNDVTGLIGHGTQSAGVIGARTNNTTGVAGIAGGFHSPGDGCRVMPIQVGLTGVTTSVIDDAILYAVDNGAAIINMSLQVPQTVAITTALDNAVGVDDRFVAAASGNSFGTNNVVFPARHPDVVAVAGTTSSDTAWVSSSGGPEVWVSAAALGVWTTDIGLGYTSTTGTSFAAPQVAAVAGLMLSVNPALSAVELRDILRDTAEDIEQPGFDVATGWGRINAYQAVLAADACSGSTYCTSVANSTGAASTISYSGSLSISTNDTVLAAEALPLSQNGVFFYGPGQQQAAFGIGWLCVTGPHQRLAIVNSGAGGMVDTWLDVTNPPQANGQITSGSTWYFQYYYRDPAAGGVAFNTSDAVVLTFCP